MGSADTGLWFYRARCLRVTDGDTFRLAVDAGFGVRVEIDLRLAGVDAPETETVAGQLARSAAMDLLAEHDADPQSSCTPLGERDRWPLRATTLRRASGAAVRSFERWVGTLTIVPSEGEPIDVAAWLVGAGHLRAVVPA